MFSHCVVQGETVVLHVQHHVFLSVTTLKAELSFYKDHGSVYSTFSNLKRCFSTKKDSYCLGYIGSAAVKTVHPCNIASQGEFQIIANMFFLAVYFHTTDLRSMYKGNSILHFDSML